MLELHGENIILREFSDHHLHDPEYFRWLRDLTVVEGIFRLEYMKPLRFEVVEDYVNVIMRSKNDCLFAVHDRETKKFIGTQKIGHIDWRLGRGDIGIMIGDANYRGKGLSADIITAACRYAFNNLSLRKLTGGTSENNVSMQRCFAKVGFQCEGRLRKQLLSSGQYIDHLLYGLLRDEFTYLHDGSESHGVGIA